MKITKQEGNKIWINSQLGWGDENIMQRLLKEGNGVLNEESGEWYRNIKFIYLTVYSDYMNGTYCGQKTKYRISKSNTIFI